MQRYSRKKEYRLGPKPDRSASDIPDNYKLSSFLADLAKVPADVDYLDFESYAFSTLTPESQRLVFSKIPVNVTFIKTVLSESQVIKKIPKHIRGIEFDIGYEIPLSEVIASLPLSIHEVVLSSIWSSETAKVISYDALVKTISVIPDSVTVFELGANKLNNLSDEEFIKVFSAFPPHLKTLKINDNHLNFRSTDVLIKAFKSLRSDINVLDLSFNELGSIERPEELISIFQALPASVTELYLDGNKLGLVPLPTLQKILAAIPSHVTNLHLNNNGDDNGPSKKHNNLLSALNSLSPKITAIHIGGNDNGDCDSFQLILETEIQQIFEIMKADRLVGGDNFTLFSGSEVEKELLEIMNANPPGISIGKVRKAVFLDPSMLVRAGLRHRLTLGVIPSTVTAIDLGDSVGFGMSSNEQLKEKLADLHGKVIKLSMCDNNLWNPAPSFYWGYAPKSAAELEATFAGIPRTIQILDLSNVFATVDRGPRHGYASIGKLFSHLPELHTLNLSRNNFGFIPAQELAVLLSHIPASVKVLDLSNNAFVYYSDTDLGIIFSAIPKTIETVIFEKNGLGIVVGKPACQGHRHIRGDYPLVGAFSRYKNEMELQQTRAMFPPHLKLILNDNCIKEEISVVAAAAAGASAQEEEKERDIDDEISIAIAKERELFILGLLCLLDAAAKASKQVLLSLSATNINPTLLAALKTFAATAQPNLATASALIPAAANSLNEAPNSALDYLNDSIKENPIISEDYAHSISTAFGSVQKATGVGLWNKYIEYLRTILSGISENEYLAVDNEKFMGNEQLFALTSLLEVAVTHSTEVVEKALPSAAASVATQGLFTHSTNQAASEVELDDKVSFTSKLALD